MKAFNIFLKLSLSVLLCISLPGCKKYLDEKPDGKLVIPATLQDMQALLDNNTKLNRNDIAAAEASADDYYLTPADYTALAEPFRRIYTWEKDNLFAAAANDWSNTYENILIANTVIDNMAKVQKTAANQSQWNDVMGQALFLRAYGLLQAVYVWCPAYDPSTADTDLGLPLRQSSDINEKIFRSSVAQTYNQIIQDLKKSASALNTVPVHIIRASKPVAYALLARTYLSMRQYENCLLYADSSLKIKSTLLDFNTPNVPNPNAAFPFNVSTLLYNNPEILYASRMITTTILGNTRAKINLPLYQSYQTDDLRKTIFFAANTGVNINTYGFKGSFEGNANLFTGPTVGETILMRAECFARSGMTAEAMNDLNTLMRKRWRNTVTYPVIAASSAADALAKVLTERRKELVMRGLRWMDIKRFNKEGAGIELKRDINGQMHTLPPNDLRYALPIPEDVIAISGMTQNLR